MRSYNAHTLWSCFGLNVKAADSRVTLSIFNPSIQMKFRIVYSFFSFHRLHEGYKVTIDIAKLKISQPKTSHPRVIDTLLSREMYPLRNAR